MKEYPYIYFKALRPFEGMKNILTICSVKKYVNLSPAKKISVNKYCFIELTKDFFEPVCF